MAMLDRDIGVPMSLYPVKKIDDLTLDPAPLRSNKSVADLQLAIADRESYQALLLVNVPKTSNRAVKRLVGQLSPDQLYSATIKDTTDRVFSSTNLDTDGILRSLDDIAEDATLYVHWDAPMLSEPDPSTGDVADQIKDMLKKKTRPMAASIELFAREVQAKRPDVKLVIAVPASDLRGRDLRYVEVMALDKIDYAFGAVSFAQRVDKYTKTSLPGIDLKQAIATLRPVQNDVLRDVVKHGRVIKTRKIVHEPHIKANQMAALEEAVKVFARRAHGPDASAEASDTSYARQFMVSDAVLKSFTLDSHVAGVDQEIKNFAKMLRNYDTYKKFLPEANKNLLLEGPAGTGKTTIARAIAAELGFPLFAPKSSDLINSYIGKSAGNVYKLFTQVREYARQTGTTAVLFIDEADAVLARRGGGQSAEREYARVVNAFLESLEGLDEDACNRLVVVLSTNLAEQLDPGIASRFGTKIEVPLPSQEILAQIFKIHLRERQHDLDDDDISALAGLAHHYSGRDVVNVLRTADRTVFARMVEGADKPPLITRALLTDLIKKDVSKRAKGTDGPPPEGMYV